MDLKEEIKTVKELEQDYKRKRMVTGSLKASDAFHAWHKAMLILFNKVVPADNEDFQYIKNQDASGNEYVLKGVYDDISGRYAMLMDDIENGKYSESTRSNFVNGLVDVWMLIHPSIAEVSKKRMKDGYYADAVEAACKALNSRVRGIVYDQTGEELDGAKLMRRALSKDNPIICIASPASKSGQDTQQGYMDIFAGVMTGIRNPKAHDNETITIEDAYRKLIMISILMYKIDGRIIVD